MSSAKTQLGSVENKKVAYQIAKYLKSMKDASTSHANREELDGIINQLSGIFEVDLTSIDDFKAYNYYQYSFPELFAAGVEALDGKHYEEGLKEAEANPKYKPFLDSIVKKNYFVEAEKGTLEDYQKRARVLSKFREKMMIQN